MNPDPKNPGDQARDATPKARQRDRQAQPRYPQTTSPPQPNPRTYTRPYAPAWRVEVLINPDLRARDPNRPLTLCEALEIGRQPKPDRQPEPDLELEAEP